MVLKLLEEGHEVGVWNRSSAPTQELKLKVQSSKFKVAETIEELVSSLPKPRVIWMMLPAGSATKEMIEEVLKFVEKEDIVIDGGNAHFEDTELHYNELKTKNVKYLGIGVSGGILASENGYPLMVGGDRSAYEYIKPILESLSRPNGGYNYFGEGGAGHFVKMVHNGIEYGMLQAIGEGFGILEKSQYNFDLLEVAKIWQKGTIISSFLMDRAVDALVKDPKLANITGVIDATGEAEWAIREAKKENVPVEIIEKSFEFRLQSKTNTDVQNSFAAKMVAALRHEFGGHKVRK
jgi:6-phosphogluconate dehydrogenase